MTETRTILAPKKLEYQKLYWVDALRGIAVLGVILVHTGQMELVALDPAVVRFTDYGSLGVQLFFVVSAFTLLLSMTARAAKEKTPIRNFFIRRFFRIAPMFYIGLGVSVLIDGLQPRFFAPDGLRLHDIFATALFLNGWQANTLNSVVPGGWSIAVETTFYAILPLLFIGIRTFSASLLAWALTVVIACLTSPLSEMLAGPNCPRILVDSFSYMWFPAQLPVFVSGFVLFFAIREKVRPIQFILVQGGSTLILICTYIANKMLGLHFYLHLTSTIAGTIFSGLGYYLYHFKSSFLVNRLTRHTGVVSFSAYISHFWVIRLLGVASFISRIPSSIRLPFTLLLVVPATILLSTVFYRVIEIPLQNVGKALIRRM